MGYSPRQIPEVGTVEELRAWLNEELKILSQSFSESNELELRASRHAPDKPREGMIIHADGTSWNPGSGAGTYRYQSGIWVKIPAPTDIPVVERPITLVGDTNYTILSTDRNVFTNTAFTATRTWTLPAASAILPYQEILVFDRKLATTATNKLIVQRAGSDTIDDVLTSITFPDVGLGIRFISDGVSKWAAVWEFINQGSMLDNVGATRGSLLYRGASGWTERVPNTSGFVLTDGGAGADPTWAALPASGGMTLIADAVGFPAAATWSVTGLGGYKTWMVDFQGVSQSSGTSRAFQAALSGNNGSSYGSIRQPVGGTAHATGASTNMRFFVSRLDKTNNQMLWMSSFIAGGNQIETGSLGPINAIQFSWGGAATNFTAGVLDIYGIK